MADLPDLIYGMPWAIEPLNYSPAILADDIILDGSDVEDSPLTKARRQQRREDIGQRYLRGQMPFIQSAQLKGPFGRESKWINPWRYRPRAVQKPRSFDSKVANDEIIDETIPENVRDYLNQLDDVQPSLQDGIQQEHVVATDQTRSQATRSQQVSARQLPVATRDQSELEDILQTSQEQLELLITQRTHQNNARSSTSKLTSKKRKPEASWLKGAHIKKQPRVDQHWNSSPTPLPITKPLYDQISKQLKERSVLPMKIQRKSLPETTANNFGPRDDNPQSVRTPEISREKQQHRHGFSQINSTTTSTLARRLSEVGYEEEMEREKSSVLPLNAFQDMTSSDLMGISQTPGPGSVQQKVRQHFLSDPATQTIRSESCSESMPRFSSRNHNLSDHKAINANSLRGHKQASKFTHTGDHVLYNARELPRDSPEVIVRHQSDLKNEEVESLEQVKRLSLQGAASSKSISRRQTLRKASLGSSERTTKTSSSNTGFMRRIASLNAESATPSGSFQYRKAQRKLTLKSPEEVQHTKESSITLPTETCGTNIASLVDRENQPSESTYHMENDVTQDQYHHVDEAKAAAEVLPSVSNDLNSSSPSSESTPDPLLSIYAPNPHQTQSFRDQSLEESNIAEVGVNMEHSDIFATRATESETRTEESLSNTPESQTQRIESNDNNRDLNTGNSLPVIPSIGSQPRASNSTLRVSTPAAEFSRVIVSQDGKIQMNSNTMIELHASKQSPWETTRMTVLPRVSELKHIGSATTSENGDQFISTNFRAAGLNQNLVKSLMEFTQKETLSNGRPVTPESDTSVMRPFQDFMSPSPERSRLASIAKRGSKILYNTMLSNPWTNTTKPSTNKSKKRVSFVSFTSNDEDEIDDIPLAKSSKHLESPPPPPGAMRESQSDNPFLWRLKATKDLPCTADPAVRFFNSTGSKSELQSSPAVGAMAEAFIAADREISYDEHGNHTIIGKRAKSPQGQQETRGSTPVEPSFAITPDGKVTAISMVAELLDSEEKLDAVIDDMDSFLEGWDVDLELKKAKGIRTSMGNILKGDGNTDRLSNVWAD